ncbi:hypothetical protein QQP08_009724, partial [Theobroma cacao]
MDSKVSSDKVSQELARELLIAISYSVPDTDDHASKNVDSANGVAVANADGAEKYRTFCCVILLLMLGYFACDSLYGSVNKGTYFCTDHVVIKVKDVFSLLDRIYVLFQSLGSFFLLVLCIEQVSIGLARC